MPSHGRPSHNKVTNRGQLHLAPVIQASNEGVMNPTKKQPSRNDLAETLITLRAQAQIIKLQMEKIRRLELAMGRVLLAYPRLEELTVN